MLQTRWLGPYEIQEVHNNGTLTLTTIDRAGHYLKVNGHQVHVYHKPLTKESFYEQVREDPSMKILVAGSDDLATFLS